MNQSKGPLTHTPQTHTPQTRSSHTSSVPDWTNSSPLSQNDVSRMEYASVTAVLFGPRYADVMNKLLDNGRQSEAESLQTSFNNALLRVMEKNTELAAISTSPLAEPGEYKPQSKWEVAKEAGKLSLERFLKKDELKKLRDTPLERWGSSEIQYARTLISFAVAAKYGKIGAFQDTDRQVLFEMLVKLFKHPRVNKYAEFLREIETQRQTFESRLQKQSGIKPEMIAPPNMPTIEQLVQRTRKNVFQKIWGFLMRDHPVIPPKKLKTR